ncbi:MAG: acyl-CoA reductase [Bacteroidetes bacterium GWF2_33_16]|nr:MAG: acyl-CoA reductase [Bacteroidetes bacterium GWE2_32_14]OFY06624.1 MAG: acyl-CoA reductase [Bacteroidetes bacterium GWF2_33_16]
MKLTDRIESFIKIGNFLLEFTENKNMDSGNFKKLSDIVKNDHLYNPWFTEENIRKAIGAIANLLQESNINKWVSEYPKLDSVKEPKRIGVVTAGNLPLVGFHDFLSVLISGHIFKGKLSSKDNRLMRFITDFLIETSPEFQNLIFFEEQQLTNFDAIIATGSNNTSRYFEYYFAKYPHIIRRNRNSIAVLTGKETNEQLTLLADDIFQYFGLGCRNVSKLFVPEGYNFDLFFESTNHYQQLYQHNKYANNHDYNRSVYLMNQIQHLDNGFVLLKEDIQIASPIGVLYFEYYRNLEYVNQFIDVNKDQIQCVVSGSPQIIDAIPFGKAQQPELWDYADNIDTLKFLINL